MFGSPGRIDYGCWVLLPPAAAPPRPEVAAPLASLVLALAVYAASGDAGLAVAAGVLTLVIIAPVLLVMREIFFLSGSRRLQPGDVHAVLEWVEQAARLAGIDRVALLYAVRRSAELQLVYVSTTNIALAPGEEYGLAATLHRAAWQGRPVGLERNGVVFLALPTLILEKLLAMLQKRRGRPVLRVSSLQEARLAYTLVRELLQAGRGLRGVQLAYSSYKLFTRLLLEGLLAVDWSVIDQLERVMPFERPWVRKRVLEQVRLETASSLE